jgi:hypothetical protein
MLVLILIVSPIPTAVVSSLPSVPAAALPNVPSIPQAPGLPNPQLPGFPVPETPSVPVGSSSLPFIPLPAPGEPAVIPSLPSGGSVALPPSPSVAAIATHQIPSISDVTDSASLTASFLSIGTVVVTAVLKAVVSSLASLSIPTPNLPTGASPSIPVPPAPVGAPVTNKTLSQRQLPISSPLQPSLPALSLPNLPVGAISNIPVGGQVISNAANTVQNANPVAGAGINANNLPSLGLPAVNSPTVGVPGLQASNGLTDGIFNCISIAMMAIMMDLISKDPTSLIGVPSLPLKSLIARDLPAALPAIPSLPNLGAAGSLLGGVGGGSLPAASITNAAQNLPIGALAGGVPAAGNVAGNLPNAGSITQNLPVGSLPNTGNIIGNLPNVGNTAGSLPNVGSIAQNLPTGSLPGVGNIAGNLPNIGNVAGSLPNTGALTGALPGGDLSSLVQSVITGIQSPASVASVMKDITAIMALDLPSFLTQLPSEGGEAGSIMALYQILAKMNPTGYGGLAKLTSMDTIKQTLATASPHDLALVVDLPVIGPFGTNSLENPTSLLPMLMNIVDQLETLKPDMNSIAVGGSYIFAKSLGMGV